MRRRLSVILSVEGPGGTPASGGAALLVCKGALEELVPLCSQVEDGERLLPMDDAARAHLSELGASMNQEGLRVLGVAVRAMPCLGAALAAAAAGCGGGGGGGGSSSAGAGGSPSSVLASQKQQQWGGSAAAGEGGGSPPAPPAAAALWSTGDEAELTFIGILAFLDPPKDSARQAVAALQARAVGIKVLTGDALPVACKVCREVGIPADDTLTGPELDKLSPPELAAAVERATVLARLDPLQKARVVGALQAAGHTVTFLGDGINDTLALRMADVGEPGGGRAAALHLRVHRPSVARHGRC